MKRIMLSVFAAAITAAWAVPSSAADVTFGGQYRLRGEYRNNADFNKNVNDHTDSWGQRVRLTANAKATDDVSVKITLQDTRTWGAATSAAGGPNLTDDGTSNVTDLHESYVNVDNLLGAPVSFRAGRQELAYGDERLIGTFGWSNNGRSFDALKFMVTTDVANVDLFASKLADNGTTNTDQDFYGIYATVKAIPNNTLDLYALAVRNGSQTAANPLGFGTVIGANGFLGNTPVTSATAVPDEAQHLYTLGARLKGAVAGLDYTLEVPFQTGDVNTKGTDFNISSYAYAAKVGYTLPTPVKVRIGAEYDFASGDKDAGTAATPNDKIKTFFNLFPTNHDKLGNMDLQAWRNVKAWTVNASADVTEKVRLYAAYWNFKLAEKEDAWYGAANWNNTPTGVRGARAANSKDDLGSEVDVVATYKYNNALTAEVGYSRFFTGDFVDDYFTTTAATEDKEDQDWAYLQITANF
ncbi:MAG: alginate export family protein [Deltaproteobacteria bacterium]|nr:alginate export family protein [Deltaproteobacteria bacterium]